MEWTQSNTDSNETEADYAMNWWKPALGGLLAAGSLVPILARRAPGRTQDARPVTRARLTKLLLKAAHLSPDSEAVQWMSAHCTAQPLVWGDLAAHWLRKEGWLHSALCAGLLLPEDRPAGQFCPDAPLPRWEGARMAVRALGLEFPAAQASTCSPGFSDQAQFPAGTAGYALTAVQTGILPGHTGGRFHPRAPLSQTEAEAMALQVQRIMAGEGIPTFRCRLRHYDEDTMVQMLDPALRLRMVEGRVYACVRDLFQAEAQLRFQRGLSSLPPAVGYPARWSSRRQQVDLEKNMVYAYRAGWDRCLQGTRPGDLETHPDASTLLAPARLLFGELMVPVYDFRAKGKGHWHPWQGDWDPDSRTLTLNTYYPDGVGVSPHSPGKETPHAPVFLL